METSTVTQRNMVDHIELETTELTGRSFGYVDIFFYCCSSGKNDDQNFLFPNFERCK